ncbi:MAG: GNAT family N-acetyltransferase [Gammaproteobacteria bacterium]|nr:GNAT family N-acetyltransferase [Gammaproteobacteria bacterium]
MSTDNYVIRPYIPADAARLAVMWNESDDEWPDTFTEGVPMTEERVRNWLDPQSPLQDLVVENQNGQASVGYGSLFDEPDQRSTAYVGMLNVHPQHQGRSLCRRMLTDMADWALTHNYHRLTLHTWPANIKSLPLYKKTGFFWMPDTRIYMENYLPAILRLPAAQAFFEKHPWYTTFKRELKQVEDNQRHPRTDKMKVFIYRWEAEGDMLEAVIDPVGQAITGLETNDFAAYALMNEDEPAQGIAYPVRWRIVNKRPEAVKVNLQASGEAGIDISHQAGFTLAAGKMRTLEAKVTCTVAAPKLTRDDKDKPAPSIQTQVTIGTDTISLFTGLRYHPAVAVSTEPSIPSLLPGRPQPIYLQLRNRAGRALQGRLNLVSQNGLSVKAETLDFQTETGGYAGLPVTNSEEWNFSELAVCFDKPFPREWAP